MRRKITVANGVTFTHIYGPQGDLLDVTRSDFNPQSLGKKSRTQAVSPKLKKLLSLMRGQHGKCFYCDEIMSMLDIDPPKMPTIDEVVPQSKGGQRIRSNQVAACYSCNMKKADRDPTEDELRRLALLIGNQPALPVSNVVAEIIDALEAMDE